MKFVMSYSCGKDSTLALHHMIAQGHEPIALLTMFNEDAERTFFHGADRNMLEAYAEALQLPLLLTPAKGENYHLEMEKMENCGIDICGENGEYHTLVMNGPIFHTPIPYRTGEILEFGDFSIITVDVPL